MPFRRARRYRRPMRTVRRKRRVFRRVPRPLRLYKKYQIHAFKESCEKTNYTIPGGAAPAGYGINFQLADLSNLSGYTSLFDQYRINAVKLMMFPELTSYVSGQSFALPEMYYAIDLDDSTAPQGVGELNQRGNCKHRPFNRPISLYFRPRVQQAIFISAGTVANSPMTKNPWIDMASTNVPHYGFKACLTASNAAHIESQTIRVTVVYYISFRNTR